MKSISNNLPVPLSLLPLPPQPEILVETKEKPVKGSMDGKGRSGLQWEKCKAEKRRSPHTLHSTAGFRPKQLKMGQGEGVTLIFSIEIISESGNIRILKSRV